MEDLSTAFGKRSFVDVLRDYFSQTNSGVAFDKAFGVDPQPQYAAGPGYGVKGPPLPASAPAQGLGVTAKVTTPATSPNISAQTPEKQSASLGVRSPGFTGKLLYGGSGNTMTVTHGDGSTREISIPASYGVGGVSAPVNMSPIEYQKSIGEDVGTYFKEKNVNDIMNQLINNPNLSPNRADTLAKALGSLVEGGKFGVALKQLDETSRHNKAIEDAALGQLGVAQNELGVKQGELGIKQQQQNLLEEKWGLEKDSLAKMPPP